MCTWITFPLYRFVQLLEWRGAALQPDSRRWWAARIAMVWECRVGVLWKLSTIQTVVHFSWAYIMHRWNLITEQLITKSRRVRGLGTWTRTRTLPCSAPRLFFKFYSIIPTRQCGWMGKYCKLHVVWIHFTFSLFTFSPCFSLAMDKYTVVCRFVIIKRCMLMNDLPTCSRGKPYEK